MHRANIMACTVLFFVVNKALYVLSWMYLVRIDSHKKKIRKYTRRSLNYRRSTYA